eukprot:14001313-Heterocapsa_arctica.AAC.1
MTETFRAVAPRRQADRACEEDHDQHLHGEELYAYVPEHGDEREGETPREVHEREPVRLRPVPEEEE